MISFRLLSLPLAPLVCLTMSALGQTEHKERHLGPTGLFGITSPTDIKITKVEIGSPADGKIKEGDVITAAGGSPFKDQTRKQFAAAIDQAESKDGGGTLTLTLNDAREVDLKLPVLGNYSATAPFGCPKTDAIITRAADHIVAKRDLGREDLPIALLGLLATGEPKYIDFVKTEVHAAKWAKPDVALTLSPESNTWSYGYTALLLCEYHLVTGDPYVLPAIKTYAVTLAKGRDAAGLWGHRMADPAVNRGQLHGRLFGYAVMNQSSLPCFIALLLAEKCGVKDPEVRAAVVQNQTFYASFIGKGTLPYGVHNPSVGSYNNNGMSGLAAIAMSLSGNKKGAAFFSRMSVAAHSTLEKGHTGHYFNQLWTGLGSNLAGPEATAAFSRESRWLDTLNRSWDGGFTYDCSAYNQPIYSYRDLSSSGAHLLNYCLGREKLFITGRNADPSLFLKGSEVDETIALATLDLKAKSDTEVLALFGHPMPKVRADAASMMRLRRHKLIDDIRKMARQGTTEQRLSAIGYFGNRCPPEQAKAAFDDLATIMRDPAETQDIRAAASASLASYGEAAYPLFREILGLVIADEPADPLGLTDESLGLSLFTLCPDPYAAGLVEKDDKLFYTAVNKLLIHKRALGRSNGAKLIANIPLEDFHYVADQIHGIIEDKDLSYHSYHNLDAKSEAISIYAELGIQGGIEYALTTWEAKTGRGGFKIRLMLNVLPKYGANAQYALPKIKAIKVGGKFQKKWDAMILQIEAAPASNKKMITFEEAKQAGKS